MIWNNHYAFSGKHSLLSPSKHHWVNYTEDKLMAYYDNHEKAIMGTRLHAFAAEAIRLRMKLPQTNSAINMFVNDCIGYRMNPEVVLYYSEYAFGSADAIGFFDKTLRISDLKTGTSPGSFTQLEIYAAFFCLEYQTNPNDIEMVLRIYHENEVRESYSSPETIFRIIGTIKRFDDIIRTRGGNDR